MKFAIDIWFAPEDIEAYKESGMLGCADEEHHFDTLEEAMIMWTTTPRNAFHMQLTHYPNYELDEWGDGNILAEGRTDDYIMLMELGLTEDDGLEFGEWLSEEEE